MAIDSERKRKSVAGIHGTPWQGVVIVPDGSFAQADRQTVGWGYYGILAAAAAVVRALASATSVSVAVSPTAP